MSFSLSKILLLICLSTTGYAGDELDPRVGAVFAPSLILPNRPVVSYPQTAFHVIRNGTPELYARVLREGLSPDLSQHGSSIFFQTGKPFGIYSGPAVGVSLERLQQMPTFSMQTSFPTVQEHISPDEFIVGGYSHMRTFHEAWGNPGPTSVVEIEYKARQLEQYVASSGRDFLTGACSSNNYMRVTCGKESFLFENMFVHEIMLEIGVDKAARMDPAEFFQVLVKRYQEKNGRLPISPVTGGAPVASVGLLDARPDLAPPRVVQPTFAAKSKTAGRTVARQLGPSNLISFATGADPGAAGELLDEMVAHSREIGIGASGLAAQLRTINPALLRGGGQLLMRGGVRAGLWGIIIAETVYFTYKAHELGRHIGEAYVAQSETANINEQLRELGYEAANDSPAPWILGNYFYYTRPSHW